MDTDIEPWDLVQQVNLTSVYVCCKTALPCMLEQKAGPNIKHRLLRGGDARDHVVDLPLRLEGRCAV